MTYEQQLATMLTKMNAFLDTLYAVQMKRFSEVDVVNNSEKLSGYTLEQVLQRLTNKVVEHTNRKGENTHSTSASELGSLNSSDITNIVESFMDKNIPIPLSYYPGSRVVSGGWTLSILDTVPCFINGEFGLVSPIVKTFNPVTDEWGQWHVWLAKEAGEFKYKFYKEDDTQPNNSHLYLGPLFTKSDPKGVDDFELKPSISLDGYRLSKWRASKSIPILEGPVNMSSKLNWY